MDRNGPLDHFRMPGEQLEVRWRAYRNRKPLFPRASSEEPDYPSGCWFGHTKLQRGHAYQMLWVALRAPLFQLLWLPATGLPAYSAREAAPERRRWSRPRTRSQDQAPCS